MPRGKRDPLDLLSFLTAERRQEVVEEALGSRLRGVFERNSRSTLGKLIDDLTTDELWSQMQHVRVSAVLRRDNAASAARTPGRRGRPPGRRNGVSSDSLDQLVEFIRKNPGLRSEQIQGELQLAPGAVKAALAKLRAERRVKTAGQRRATTYTAA
jgi:hypothetical protein